MGAITSEARAVSVVIPTWNAGARFVRVLDALDAQDVHGGLELVVVDSTSRDGTAERARARGARVLSIPQSEFGHGRTRNYAIARTSGAVVLLLTQDAVPLDAGYARALVSAFADARVEGAYARQFPRADCDPILAERLRRWSAARTQRSVASLGDGDAEAARRSFAALAPLARLEACAFDNVASAVRRTSWQRHPFPERRFGEDVAWAREIQLAGGAIAFEPDARVEHSHRISIRREFKRLYCDHRNLYELFGLRNVPSWSAVRSGARFQIGVYRELLAAQELAASARLFWRLYSIPYAWAETAAQFLGARSHWKVPESRFWAWVDRRAQRGS
jgi:rhamnosyltransferase